MIPQSATLDEVLERVEALLLEQSFTEDDTSATAYKLADRVADKRVHLGLTVFSPTTTNTHGNDEVVSAWVEDTVTITLSIQVARTSGQRTTRNHGVVHEARIRTAVVSDPELQALQPTFEGVTRTVSPDRMWLDLEQTFTFQRLEAMRQVA